MRLTSVIKRTLSRLAASPAGKVVAFVSSNVLSGFAVNRLNSDWDGIAGGGDVDFGRLFRDRWFLMTVALVVLYALYATFIFRLEKDTDRFRDANHFRATIRAQFAVAISDRLCALAANASLEDLKKMHEFVEKG